jgi:hypothetical protein
MADTSLTVQFQAVSTETDTNIVAELDDDRNSAANNGRTSSFKFGDTVYYRVYTNPVDGMDVTCYNSDGTITYHGKYSESDREQVITFAEPPESKGGDPDDNTASLDVPCESGFSAELLGTTGCGSVYLSTDDPEVAKASQTGVGVYRATYDTEYFLYGLSNVAAPSDWPAGESYPVVILIVGTLSDG